MKTLHISFAICLFTLQAAFSQPTPPRPTLPQPTPAPGAQLEEKLPKFNLDFPGGGPKELVAAMEKASGKSVNALISEKYDDVSIPPMKFTDVTVPAVFAALEEANRKTTSSGFPPGIKYTGFGFNTIQ